MEFDDPPIKVAGVPTLRGALAKAAGYDLPLAVLQSRNGYYVGTSDEQGPVSRESVEYWDTEVKAAHALTAGSWTQRLTP